MPRPCRNADEDPCRRVLREIPGIDRVDRGKLLDRRAVDIAFQHLLERRARRLEAELHLFEHELGLALERCVDDLTGCRIEGWKPRNVERVAMLGHGRRGRVLTFQPSRSRFAANNLSAHGYLRLFRGAYSGRE